MNPKNILSEKFTMGNILSKISILLKKKKPKKKKDDFADRVSKKLYPKKVSKKTLKNLEKSVDGVNKSFDSMKKFYKKQYDVDLTLKDIKLSDILDDI